MKYKPSEVLIAVHAGRPTSLAAAPNEIGTVDNPAEEGVDVDITATLTTKQGAAIEAKTLHFYGSDGTELSTGNTDANGQTVLTYTVNITDDGKDLKIAYLGD